MVSLPSSTSLPSTTVRCAVAVSRDAEIGGAMQALADQIRHQLGGVSPDLACVFFSSHHREQAARLAEVLDETLGARVCVGSSGEGVIAGAEELETSPAVAVWAACLPGVTLTPVRLSYRPEDDRCSMVGWPEPDVEGSTFLLVADPFTTPMQDVLALLEERYPGSPAIGGLAGGGQEPGENRVLLGREVFDHGLVGVRIAGPVSIRPVISQGCRPVGDRYMVTKGEQNLIHELSGVPALERLRAVFESLDREERLRAHRALHIGIVIDEHRERFERGDFLVRNLVGADQTSGAVAIGDVVQEGQTVQFHVRDAQSASDDLRTLLEADLARHRHRPVGALVFSCCGRGQGLFGRPHHDAGLMAEQLQGVPVAGFFAQGEIGPVGGRNFVHGYTASMALFAEPAERPQQSS